MRHTTDVDVGPEVVAFITRSLCSLEHAGLDALYRRLAADSS